MVPKWVGLVWITAVLANVAKFAVTARGAFFSWTATECDDDAGDDCVEREFILWYVWLEFGLIVGFIWIFWFISTEIMIRNPYLRSNYVIGPTLPEPEEVTREIVIPPPAPQLAPRLPPIYTSGGGAPGFAPLPGYRNGGFQEPQRGDAPPPLYISSPGYAGASAQFGFPDVQNLQPMPGYRPPPGQQPPGPPGPPGGFGQPPSGFGFPPNNGFGFPPM